MSDHERSHLRPRKIAIVGAGNVGATFAYTLLLRGLVGEIVLIDINRQRAEGEAMDLLHAAPLSHAARIWVGDYSDCADADIVMISAGVGQRPGETRLDLLKRNVEVFRQIIPSIVAHNNGILLIATNPVDILSYAAWKLSGWPAERVIGSGTVLDTARFRALLGEHLHVDPRSVHAYIIGEHGDSEVPVWSLANVAGMRLDDYCTRASCSLTSADRDEIARRVRDAAYEIIARKGATYYAVAVGLARIAESILHDQHTVLSVSNLVPPSYNLPEVYLSLPSIVSSTGVEEVLHLPLNPEEENALRHSAQLLRQAIDELDI